MNKRVDSVGWFCADVNNRPFSLQNWASHRTMMHRVSLNGRKRDAVILNGNGQYSVDDEHTIFLMCDSFRKYSISLVLILKCHLAACLWFLELKIFLHQLSWSFVIWALVLRGHLLFSFRVIHFDFLELPWDNFYTFEIKNIEKRHSSTIELVGPITSAMNSEEIQNNAVDYGSYWECVFDYHWICAINLVRWYKI